jgi:hypothetical protein
MIAIKIGTAEATVITTEAITTMDITAGMTGAGETAMAGDTAIATTGAGEIAIAIGTTMVIADSSRIDVSLLRAKRSTQNACSAFI